jgi:hypothetical protein
MATSDGAALLAATVRAAILDQAPRRTVQAVAVGVFGALLAATTAAPGSSAREGAGAQCTTATGSARGDSASAQELLEALRVPRSTRRRAKKQRREASKSAGLAAAQEHESATELLDGAAALHGQAVAVPSETIQIMGATPAELS